MQRLAVSVIAIAVVIVAAVVSMQSPQPATGAGADPVAVAAAPASLAINEPQIETTLAEKNPWTHLVVNKEPREFRFAIVTDRTGGHRPGVFGKAVDKLNLLQPEFVMSVGDLIEGYSFDAGQWALEWSEFQGKVNKIQAPFFYTAGNHDMANPAMTKNWERKFGRKYYDFVYQDALFLVLLSEDPPGRSARFSAEQRTWLKQTLEKHKLPRWTFVFLHKPAWLNRDTVAIAEWAEIERMLASRPHTVFAGHVHEYARFVRNGGRDYIMLGTTGGGSQLRGKQYGEVDHITWITMKKSGPVIANLILDGIEDKGFRTLEKFGNPD